MSYPPRIFESDNWYHVFTKGQRSEPLFFSPNDRIAYLSFLDRELSRRDGLIGSYCLMTNHLHLLMFMQETPLNRIFQTTHMKYAKYFHEKRDTEGHVFQDRPGMKIVLKESYLQDLTGYIHQNPVEAGMVEKVQDYEWSSWKWFLSGEIKDIKSGLFPPGFEDDSRKSFYEVIESDFDLPEGEHYWGTQGEWEQLEKRREGREGRKFRERRDRRPMDEIVDQFVEDSDYTKEELKSQSRRRELSNVRHKAMKELYEVGYTPSEIGPYFNRTPAAVNYALRQQDEE